MLRYPNKNIQLNFFFKTSNLIWKRKIKNNNKKFFKRTIIPTTTNVSLYKPNNIFFVKIKTWNNLLSNKLFISPYTTVSYLKNIKFILLFCQIKLTKKKISTQFNQPKVHDKLLSYI